MGCAGAIAGITAVLEQDVPGLAARKGAYFLQHLQTLQEKYPQVIVAARGLGLLMGLEMKNAEIGCELENRLLADRVLVGGPESGSRVIRLIPPAVITTEQIDQVVAKLDKHLAAICSELANLVS